MQIFEFFVRFVVKIKLRVSHMGLFRADPQLVKQSSLLLPQFAQAMPESFLTRNPM